MQLKLTPENARNALDALTERKRGDEQIYKVAFERLVE